MHWRRAALVALICLPAIAPSPARSETAKIAAFDFELIDTSLEGEVSGPRADEQDRLDLISEDLRRRLRDSGRYDLLDLAPAREAIDDIGHLHGCLRCAVSLARDLGADLALTGTVQKVSNLILNINLYVHDTGTGKTTRAMSVDVRGNNDKSWMRGVSYLVRNRLLRDDP